MERNGRLSVILFGAAAGVAVLGGPINGEYVVAGVAVALWLALAIPFWVVRDR